MTEQKKKCITSQKCIFYLHTVSLSATKQSIGQPHLLTLILRHVLPEDSDIPYCRTGLLYEPESLQTSPEEGRSADRVTPTQHEDKHC